jgi:hypothetical protein
VGNRYGRKILASSTTQQIMKAGKERLEKSRADHFLTTKNSPTLHAAGATAQVLTGSEKSFYIRGNFLAMSSLCSPVFQRVPR